MLGFHDSYTQLPDMFYQYEQPTAVRQAEWVLFNQELATELNLPYHQGDLKTLQYLSGNQVPPQAKPFAQAYAGHQFGHFTTLGDGRAILLGEHELPDGKRVDIQLKGAGQTAYSRRGDGRATLSSMLREYIMSEALHALGIPTTRSLAVISTGETVQREEPLPGAVLTRVASSHVRVGTFEYARAMGMSRPSNTQEDGNSDEGDLAIRALADYTLARHFSEFKTTDLESPYEYLLTSVMERQAKLVAQWMGVGFIHGVMNTDNMAISGETIDYGPCAMMDEYDPKTVFSFIDRQGRYAYQNQPIIAQWNLARFAETLLPLLHTDANTAIDTATRHIQTFPDRYEYHWQQLLYQKLGFLGDKKHHTAYDKLSKEWLALLEKHQCDWTNSFHDLSVDAPNAEEDNATHKDEFAEFRASLLNTEAGINFRKEWLQVIENQQGGLAQAQEQMRAVNPVIIPRNHQVDEALRQAERHQNLAPLHQLLQVLKTPFQNTPDKAPYQHLPTSSERIEHTFCGT